jgi:hypothetical protein
MQWLPRSGIEIRLPELLRFWADDGVIGIIMRNLQVIR